MSGDGNPVLFLASAAPSAKVKDTSSPFWAKITSLCDLLLLLPPPQGPDMVSLPLMTLYNVRGHGHHPICMILSACVFYTDRSLGICGAVSTSPLFKGQDWIPPRTQEPQNPTSQVQHDTIAPTLLDSVHSLPASQMGCWPSNKEPSKHVATHGEEGCAAHI